MLNLPDRAHQSWGSSPLMLASRPACFLAAMSVAFGLLSGGCLAGNHGEDSEAVNAYHNRRNLRSVAEAILHFYTIHNSTPFAVSDAIKCEPVSQISWRVRILSELSHHEIASMYSVEAPWNASENARALCVCPEEYRVIARKSSENRYMNCNANIVAGSDARERWERALQKWRDPLSKSAGDVLLIQHASLKMLWTDPEEPSLSRALDLIEGHARSGAFSDKMLIVTLDEDFLVREVTIEEVRGLLKMH